MQETQEIRVLSYLEDILEEEIATHSSIFAWKSCVQRGVVGLQFKGRQRISQDWACNQKGDLDPSLFSILIIFSKCFPWLNHKLDNHIQAIGVQFFQLTASHLYVCMFSAVSDSLQFHGLWPPGSWIQAILEWVSIFYSRGSFWPRDGTLLSCVSCIGRQILYQLCYLGSPGSQHKEPGMSGPGSGDPQSETRGGDPPAGPLTHLGHREACSTQSLTWRLGSRAGDTGPSHHGWPMCSLPL